MRSTPSLGAVDGGAGAEEDDDGDVPVLLAVLPLPSLELHAASASAARMIAAMSEKKRRIQLTSNNYSAPAHPARSLICPSAWHRPSPPGDLHRAMRYNRRVMPLRYLYRQL